MISFRYKIGNEMETRENRLAIRNNTKGENNLIYFSLPLSFAVLVDYSRSCATWSVSFQFCFFQFHMDT